MPSDAFIEKLNEQIGYEFSAERQYIAIAAHYDAQTLPRLATLFYKQAVEERNHAMMMVKYLLDRDAAVKIPGVEEPRQHSRALSVYSTTNASTSTNAPVASGRFFTDADMDAKTSVCVLGAEMAPALFPLDSPLGKHVRVGAAYYQVIGIMEPRGQGPKTDETQDTYSVRDKSTGHGKKTADKWNQ